MQGRSNLLANSPGEEQVLPEDPIPQTLGQFCNWWCIHVPFHRSLFDRGRVTVFIRARSFVYEHYKSWLLWATGVFQIPREVFTSKTQSRIHKVIRQSCQYPVWGIQTAFQRWLHVLEQLPIRLYYYCFLIFVYSWAIPIQTMKRGISIGRKVFDWMPFLGLSFSFLSELSQSTSR